MVLGNTGNLSKEGHTFSGWNTQADTLGKNYSATDTFLINTANITLYAKWRPSTYTITFLSGVSSIPSPASQTVIYNNTYGTLPSLSRAGYSFEGWWSETGGSGAEIVSNSQVTDAANDTLYAKWTAVNYSIVYVLDNGENHANNPSNYSIESATFILQNAKKPGYEFDGWYTENTFITKITQIPAGSTGNRTFFAKWKPETYTITYVLNGGENHAQNPATYTIETSTITLLDAKQTDYDFEGWCSDSTLAAPATQIIKGSTGNRTFYTKWKWNVTCTDYDGNVYPTVKIGNQVWTTVNLRVTHFNDGTMIPYVNPSSYWPNTATPAFGYHDSIKDVSERQTFGALYNWYVIGSGILAPGGWHVPTTNEWDTLQNYLINNGYNFDYTTTDNKIAKSLASTIEWDASNDIGTVGNSPSNNNKSGFSALPGGTISFVAQASYNKHKSGTWWHLTSGTDGGAGTSTLRYNFPSLSYNRVDMRNGYSIRLIRN